jgi:hypothetical protein
VPAAIRPFERRDRDQLTALANLHVGAVIPGVMLSVNTVLGQLEREPYENMVDPWVAERLCLVAEQESGIVAATLLHRFRTDDDVSAGYRGAGGIRWLLCKVDAEPAGALLLEQALAQMRLWQVTMVGAENDLPAIACYGVPNTLPHIRRLLLDAGFGQPTRAELVLAARCEALTVHRRDGISVTRTLGLLGARFTLSADDAELGFIEVCEAPAEMARSSIAARWADIGNLILREGVDPADAMPALLSAAADWLLLGGVTRLVDYWAEDVDSPSYLEHLERAGFHVLVRNERGFTRAV